MSFPLMLLIMLVSAIIGGTVNFFLPANNPEPNKYLKSWVKCAVIGLGAVLLVPLFLAFAQSKLMDGTHFTCYWQLPDSLRTSVKQVKPDTLVINTFQDSAGKKTKPDTSVKKAPKPTGSNADNDLPKGDGTGSGKDYLLWLAYCMVAAIAGFRFINMLINNVVKQEQVDVLENKVKKSEEKEKLQQQENQLRQSSEEAKTFNKLATVSIAKGLPVTTLPSKPVLPPITVANDPQKNRFGGVASKNGRKLDATVVASNIPGFYDINFWVEADAANPLTSDVIFYIHDSFTPSVIVRTMTEIAAANNRAEHRVSAWGAFTIGAITDNGTIFLELDLAEDKRFPKKFRDL